MKNNKVKVVKLKNDRLGEGDKKEVDSSKVIKKCISEVYLNSLKEIEELINKKNG